MGGQRFEFETRRASALRIRLREELSKPRLQLRRSGLRPGRPAYGIPEGALEVQVRLALLAHIEVGFHLRLGDAVELPVEVLVNEA